MSSVFPTGSVRDAVREFGDDWAFSPDVLSERRRHVEEAVFADSMIMLRALRNRAAAACVPFRLFHVVLASQGMGDVQFLVFRRSVVVGRA